MLGAVLNLLFIGNSLTASNDLAALIEAMGRASGIPVHCTVIAKPNFSLEDHWADGDALRAIARGGWSHVILQQGLSALPESRVLLNEYARRFDHEIRSVRARTALFTVWPSSARRADFDGVSASYAGAARLTGGLLLPAGDAWRAAWQRDPALAVVRPRRIPSLSARVVSRGARHLSRAHRKLSAGRLRAAGHLRPTVRDPARRRHRRCPSPPVSHRPPQTDSSHRRTQTNTVSC